MLAQGTAHGICGAYCHTHQTTDTQAAGNHHDSLAIHGNGAGGAGRHANLALIAYVHIRGIGFVMDLNA